jgi:hypothetical protein
MSNYYDVNVLLGKKLNAVRMPDKENIYFHVDNGEIYRMYHDRDCCETVEIVDICGDLKDLVGDFILMAEMVQSKEEEFQHKKPKDYDDYIDESFTWTFYKFATIKGYVTIRWLGQSNGYYSETVDFVKFHPKDKP